MFLFYTVVIIDTDDVPGVVIDSQIHGPFVSEDDRQASIDEFENEVVDVGEYNCYVCPVNALASGADEVNLIVGD